LSGAFAHELNQPLTAILANAEVGKRLLDRKDPDIPELKEILGEIIADDKRAAETIGQLRSLLVRGEAALTPVDLNQVVTATLALAKSELVARQVSADFRRDLPAATVLGNFAQLQQIVLNLIVNAAEAMSQSPADGRVVEITVGKNKDGRYEVAVADNGPGLTKEMMEKAFKPFVSSKANGLGLGLAICRTIASAHGGTLGFDETRQGGARVVLGLPPYERQQ
jgi:C4-dicarboxylate-specific signal transduction histidine kinase